MFHRLNPQATATAPISVKMKIEPAGAMWNLRWKLAAPCRTIHGPASHSAILAAIANRACPHLRRWIAQQKYPTLGPKLSPPAHIWRRSGKRWRLVNPNVSRGMANFRALLGCSPMNKEILSAIINRLAQSVRVMAITA